MGHWCSKTLKALPGHMAGQFFRTYLLGRWPIVLFALLVKTAQAVVQAGVNFKNIVQLQQLEKFHHFRGNIAYFKLP
jgi:hypothetical protein